MRKLLTLSILATLALACTACAGAHRRAITLTSTHAPPPSAAPAPREPLALNFSGVHFDALTRAQAVQALEKVGYTPVRLSLAHYCDWFNTQKVVPAALRLLVCWVPPDKWAFSTLFFPNRAHRVFGSFLNTLSHDFGQRGYFKLDPLGPRRAEWVVDHKRATVTLTQSFPIRTTQLRFEDVRAGKELYKFVHESQAQQKTVVEQFVKFARAHQTPRARHSLKMEN